MPNPINCTEHSRTGSRPLFSNEVRPEFMYDAPGCDVAEYPLDAPDSIALGGMAKFESKFFGPMIYGAGLRLELWK